MPMQLYENVLDRSEWGSGPWDGEPDKVVWVDETTDLDCMVRRGPSGAWCGYVGVPEGHSLFGKSYHDVEMNVHGGLTFADTCDTDGPEESAICHIPEPRRPDVIWWFGFDCGHAFDLMPVYQPSHWVDRTYRDLEYVKSETLRLAKQISELAEGAESTVEEGANQSQ
jgi:hypothetical protein